MIATKKVLFLCTGNSARSQMAEGLVNHYLGDRWVAYSAGTAPTGFVHPLAVRALGELGIDISAQRSKHVGEFRSARLDLVITVCNGAARDCPVWLGSGTVVHMGFDDPAAATGTEAARLAAFLEVRDGITDSVLPHLKMLARCEDAT